MGSEQPDNPASGLTADCQLPAADYDYIIAGAGCAGLSLAVHLLRAGLHTGKRILLIDREEKRANDRTWCFWEKEAGPFESIVFRRWSRLHFYDPAWSGALQPAPYTYKMIRGADFYAHCRDLLSPHSEFEWTRAAVEGVDTSGTRTAVRIDGTVITAGIVFNSILPATLPLRAGDHLLLQHFKGWRIRTATDQFDPGAATLMDFRLPQTEGTTFCYVLPFSAREALVEYTLFSPALLQPEAYDEGLRRYIREVLKVTDYTVEEEEFGIIPMTDHAFSPGSGGEVRIGTAGGWTKGSSGYTFSFIQKRCAAIVDRLQRGMHPAGAGAHSFRFPLYDRVLLHILQRRTLEGHYIFTELFRRNPASRVLRFLDNDSRPAEELRLIATLPTLPFLKAAVRELTGR